MGQRSAKITYILIYFLFFTATIFSIIALCLRYLEPTVEQKGSPTHHKFRVYARQKAAEKYFKICQKNFKQKAQRAIFKLSSKN